MVHISDLDWNASGDEALAQYNKGQSVEAGARCRSGKRACQLGIKQLDGDPFESVANLRRGDTVTWK